MNKTHMGFCSFIIFYRDDGVHNPDVYNHISRFLRKDHITKKNDCLFENVIKRSLQNAGI